MKEYASGKDIQKCVNGVEQLRQNDYRKKKRATSKPLQTKGQTKEMLHKNARNSFKAAMRNL